MEKHAKEITQFSETESFFYKTYTDFHIDSYADVLPANLNRVVPHKHTYYEIIWVEKGEGIHEIDFVKYPFTNHSLFLLQPSHIHQINKTKPTQGFTIKFSESFFTELATNDGLQLKNAVFDNIQPSPVLSVVADDAQNLHLIFKQMRAEFQLAAPDSKKILAHYLQIFLLRVNRVIHQHKYDKDMLPDANFQVFVALKQLIESHYCEQNPVSFYAERLNVSPKKLNNIVHKHAQSTVKQLLQNRILLEAKRLLKSHTYSVKEIAYRLGFEDVAYFSRFFSQKTGVAPSVFS